MKIRKKFVMGFAISVLLFIGNEYARGENTHLDASNNTSQVDAIVQTLQHLRANPAAPYEVDIPFAVKPLMTRLKRQLCEVILDTMNTPWKTPQELQHRIVTRLRMQGIFLGDTQHTANQGEQEPDSYRYDTIQHIHIEQPAHHPELLVALTTLWVMCGTDTSFYLFQKQHTHWKLVLVQETNGYDDITGAQGQFGYAISPVDTHQQFFIVTVNINPWCSSNWQQIRYRVLRIGQTASHPILLLQREETIYIGVDPPVYTLDVTPERFTLEFRGDRHLHPDDRSATIQQTTYEIRGNMVQNISP